jgi:hypothetical protein
MSDVREEFLYLNQLRYSGETNMFGATPYLQEEFGLDRQEAKSILSEWMAWAQEDGGNVMIGVDEEDYDLDELYEDEDMTEDEEYGLALINDDEEWE